MDIQVWEPKGNNGLEPIEARLIHRNGQSVYQVRLLGELDWRKTMTQQVLEAYYQPQVQQLQTA